MTRKLLFKDVFNEEMKKQHIIDQLYKCKIVRINNKLLQDCDYKTLRRELTLAKLKVEV